MSHMLPPKFKVTYFQILDRAKYSGFTLKTYFQYTPDYCILGKFARLLRFEFS